MSLQYTCLQGSLIAPHITDLARLRIEVFREYPYLYEGDYDYEQQYLKTLAESEQSLVVLAQENGRAVGASTALPLLHADPQFQKPFSTPADYFYYGESVLLADYRGRGVGRAFFRYREEAAASGGFSRVCFCAVRRPEDHPKRPEGYRDLAPWWERQGFQKTGRTTLYPWKDLGDTGETEKVMEFWEKVL